MSGSERCYRKKALKPAVKRELVDDIRTMFSMSTRQACRTLSLSRTVYFYQSDAHRDEPVIQTLTAAAERFNRTYRTEVLDFYLLRTLNEVREMTERWLVEYNSERPHESLNNLTPEEFRLMSENPGVSKSM